ncbi:type I-F CRISPR-associated protein Csy2 [Thiococcus pfennigii]|uniref:type I-F CRISPR-associated protein Csy2 n=1 Tax=Thiococcus pfennigii TaxID=1057 RepID=UPI0019038C14|nr:type I-F CRISPR-associated protein Csy2 [Thiococcus pfennigii]MBK1733372.1 type I-F CRISPR-associated protein Csy2 [Thiococcus pfennigii]
MTDTAALLLLPRLRVQNANAIPGPLSWGFPAPSAFLGFTDALQRQLRGRFDVDLVLGGCGIVCHRFAPHVARPAGRYHRVFRLTRNPYYAGWKRGFSEDKPATLVEEGRAHLEVSLVVEVRTELHEDERPDLLEVLPDLLGAMRLAGGSLLPPHPRAVQDKRYTPQWFEWYDSASDNEDAFRGLRRYLLPGFALVERSDLLAARLAELQAERLDASALDALLDLCRLNIDPVGPDPNDPDHTLWQIRARAGWLVPLPIGYAALSPLYAPGTVRRTRDAITPFRFCESLYGLGEWVSPHRMRDSAQLLWQREASPEAGIYRCTNRYADCPPISAN